MSTLKSHNSNSPHFGFTIFPLSAKEFELDYDEFLHTDSNSQSFDQNSQKEFLSLHQALKLSKEQKVTHDMPIGSETKAQLKSKLRLKQCYFTSAERQKMMLRFGISYAKLYKLEWDFFNREVAIHDSSAFRQRERVVRILTNWSKATKHHKQLRLFSTKKVR